VARNPIRGRRDLERLPSRSVDAWDRAGNAVARSRSEGISLAASARLEHTTVATIRQYYPESLTRIGERGWWRATAWDRAYRGLVHLTTTQGDVLVELRSSRLRSLASEHARAIRAYLLNLDPDGEGLRRFRGKDIRGYRLLDDRDLDLIDELDRRGETDWPDLYERPN
jgi:hypothetical protein